MFPHGNNPNNHNPNELNPNSINPNNYNPNSYALDHPMKVRKYVKHNRSPDISNLNFKPTPFILGITFGLLIYLLI